MARIPQNVPKESLGSAAAERKNIDAQLFPQGDAWQSLGYCLIQHRDACSQSVRTASEVGINSVRR